MCAVIVLTDTVFCCSINGILVTYYMEQKPRIVSFSLSYAPHVGGAELALEYIMRELKEDFDFTVICGRFDTALAEHEDMHGVHVYRVGNGTKWDKYFFPIYAYRMARSLGVFHGSWAMMENYALIAAFFYYVRTGTRYLLSAQSGDSTSKVWSRVALMYPLYWAAHRKAYRVQAISAFLGRRVKTFGYRGEVKIVPNGVDLQMFHPADAQRQVSGSPHIVSVSRLVYKNAIDIALRAFALLPKTYTMSLAGAGSERELLEELAQGLGIGDRVQFLGSITQSSAAELLRQSDVFVRPSRSEGFGNSFIESMACGVPVVGTHAGGIKDFLVNERNGLVVDQENVKMTARCIERLIEDKALRATVIRNGLELAQHYSWATIAQKMKPLLHEVCVYS